jgi:hypothetical protein
MTCTSSRSLVRRSTIGPLAVVAALALLLVTATVALADTVHIYDAANVLNVSQVQGDASSLPYPIDIYTTNTFNGSTSAFDQRTSGHLTSSRLIVIAIDTHHKHLTIVGGKSVPLSSSQYSSAVNAFINNYSSNKDYTAATIAAIDSLKSSLGAGSSPVPGASGGGLFSGLFWPCCLGLVILVIVGVIIAAARGVFRRMFGFGGRPQGVPYQQPYQQPYNQGYPPNYGPGYNQGQGINPLVAGGLGAAGGGLIGYELGKEAGESEAREQGQGGDFGGGSSGDFGGGSSGDFGGGGGGDFGGGSSGDFGGGGGGDFGGGSSGNF